MQRTQIYLTEEEQAAICQISIRSGTSQSALLRNAIDQYIAQNTVSTHTSKRMDALAFGKNTITCQV